MSNPRLVCVSSGSEPILCFLNSASLASCSSSFAFASAKFWKRKSSVFCVIVVPACKFCSMNLVVISAQIFCAATGSSSVTLTWNPENRRSSVPGAGGKGDTSIAPRNFSICSSLVMFFDSFANKPYLSMIGSSRDLLMICCFIEPSLWLISSFTNSGTTSFDTRDGSTSTVVWEVNFFGSTRAKPNAMTHPRNARTTSTGQRRFAIAA